MTFALPIELVQLVRDHIEEHPDFPKKGIVFRDISLLLENPYLMDDLSEALSIFWKYSEYTSIDSIVGLDARGFIFGPLIQKQLLVPFVMARKKGKLPGECEGTFYGLEYGVAELEIQKSAPIAECNVLIVDDLLATGGTALAAAQLVKRLGGTVAGFQFIIELTDLGGRDKILSECPEAVIHSVVQYDS